MLKTSTFWGCLTANGPKVTAYQHTFAAALYSSLTQNLMNKLSKYIPFGIKVGIAKMFDDLSDEWYIRVTIPYLVRKIRKKDKIRFLFLLTELASWKTEMLYLALVKHSRFEPVLGVTSNRENQGAELNLLEYLRERGYTYQWINENEDLISQTRADIITFQKPYDNLRHPLHLAWNNKDSIFCCISYGLHNTLGIWDMHNRYYYLGFRYFFENSSVIDDYRPLFNARKNSLIATGVPMMDQLLQPASCYSNPWKNKDSRKRIIYAPHHTIADMHCEGIAYSTFLDYCDFMLKMAEKYKEKIVIAFKPHPRLYTNLLTYWGKEKTDSYYNEWKTRENCQFENGTYDGLFKYSDAMIHDCSSFIVEYHYSRRPILYLLGAQSDHSHMTSWSTLAYDLHYKAIKDSQIEDFIQNIIAGIDPLKAQRDSFYQTQLLPPHGKTACENIINVILGEEEYKD